jgi:hypothetical protein
MKRTTVITWVYFTLAAITICFYSQANALDDFDLAKYGPEDTIEVKRNNFIVKLVTYSSMDQLNESFEEASGMELGEEDGVRGFATVHETEDVCYVHIMPAQIWDDREAMAIMGHEIYHCALAKHKDLFKEDEYEYEYEDEAMSDEQLYAEDRLLELEWLKEDYLEMGIVITEEKK